MGVPAFFRWLSRKYPSIVVNCVEEKKRSIDGVDIPVDSTKPNPNGVEFDNLYLDMNGIIHPCCHPEGKPAPKNEDEMMVLIFEYIDRLFAIVRPRRLLYMAIDGVAPRAKMNQQRSRRFRASQESAEKRVEVSKIKEELRMKGMEVPPDKPATEHFDSNCITPGTEFMFRLADCLRYYIHHRLNNDPGWANVIVILSDANVPGEGEHKIMDYIRRQRAQPDHDPNTHHCLCGADADLIMLGLATHEPNFTIIREEFKPNQPHPCEICGQIGHELKECQGTARVKQGEHDEFAASISSEQEFIFLRLNVLREYLHHDLNMTNLPFKQDLERAIDDWVLMCFFVGNDFLPHLPSLEIREGAIDRLITLYKKAVYKTGGYLTDSGSVNLSRVQLILSDLGETEDEIFKKRRETDLEFKRRDEERKKRQRRMAGSDAPKWVMGGQYAPRTLGGSVPPISDPKQTAFEMRQQAMQISMLAKNKPLSNEDAAASLRSQLSNDDPTSRKRKSTDDVVEPEDAEPVDDVKLWEDGWKDRYYQNKFGVDADEQDFRHIVGNEYVLGMCWVLKYYYQGCASWDWYFPYHYAPFASDFINIGDLNTDFVPDTKPFKPLEQLMSVFPEGSKQFLPPSWQKLMDNAESPIIDFYPDNFRIDLNGKKFAWQGVALLPFVDEKRLLETLKDVYPNLTEYEMKRNIRGDDRHFVSRHHPVHNFLEALYENGGTTDPVEIDPKLTNGIRGTVWCDSLVVVSQETLRSPVPQLKDLIDNTAICVQYRDPQYERGYIFPSRMISGAKLPDPTLKPEDFDRRNSGQSYRPQLGFTRDFGHRGAGATNAATANRQIRAGIGGYSQVAPPSSRQPYPLMAAPYQPGRSTNDGRQAGYGQQPTSWQRNMQGQSYAYQQNQQRGYQQQGYGAQRNPYSSQGGGGSSYGNSSGSSSHRGSSYSGQSNNSNYYGGGSQRSSYNRQPAIESYSTSRGSGYQGSYGGQPGSRYPYPPSRRY